MGVWPELAGQPAERCCLDQACRTGLCGGPAAWMGPATLDATPSGCGERVMDRSSSAAGQMSEGVGPRSGSVGSPAAWMGPVMSMVGPRPARWRHAAAVEAAGCVLAICRTPKTLHVQDVLEPTTPNPIRSAWRGTWPPCQGRRMKSQQSVDRSTLAPW